jgi:hypothetical protein
MTHEPSMSQFSDEKGGSVESDPKFIFEFSASEPPMISSCCTGFENVETQNMGPRVILL